MKSLNCIYESSRLAAAYAKDRPPVHQIIMQNALQYLGFNRRFGRALDVGCGPGLSTIVLESFAKIVVGLDPIEVMLAHSHKVAPQACFLAGKAEILPFSSMAFDIITAAGSLNYVEIDQFMPEVKRVLAPEGVLLVYDFSAGRRMHGDCKLENWYYTFENRYPAHLTKEFDAESLNYQDFGLRLRKFDEFEVAVNMTLQEYLSYILSQINAEVAISLGESEKVIRSWCRDHLADLFGGSSQSIIFSAYIAYVGH